MRWVCYGAFGLILILSAGHARGEGDWQAPSHRQWHVMTGVDHVRHEPRRPPQVRAWRQRHEPKPQPRPEPTRWEHAHQAHNVAICHRVLETVGDQAASEDAAKEQARKSWIQEVRWRYGERAMTIDLARGLAFACSRSSIGSVIGQTFVRCAISGQPCEAPMTQEGK